MSDTNLAPAPAVPPVAAPSPAAAPAVAPTAAPPAQSAPSPTVAGGTPAQAPSPAADWPSDWREKMAGEDKAFLGQLKRYSSPADLAKWTRTQSLRITSGELKPALKADATPEEVAEYRKANGVPDAPATYVEKLTLPDGMMLGDADKPFLESFAETALAKNIPQDSFNKLVEWYVENQNKQIVARDQADQNYLMEAQQSLIQEMGTDFKPSMNALGTFWKNYPSEVQSMILGARTPDGRIVGNLPEVTKFFANVARELNPSSTLLPAGSDQGPKGVASRMSEIEGMMYLNGKKNPAYWNNEPVQQEYRGLIDAQARMKERAA